MKLTLLFGQRRWEGAVEACLTEVYQTAARRSPEVGVRFNMRLVILVFILATLAAACTSADQPGRIELSATEFDFGNVPNTDPVSETFQVRNLGQGTLVLCHA
jgi:hypothetical protein